MSFALEGGSASDPFGTDQPQAVAAHKPQNLQNDTASAVPNDNNAFIGASKQASTASHRIPGVASHRFFHSGSNATDAADVPTASAQNTAQLSQQESNRNTMSKISLDACAEGAEGKVGEVDPWAVTGDFKDKINYLTTPDGKKIPNISNNSGNTSDNNTNSGSRGGSVRRTSSVKVSAALGGGVGVMMPHDRALSREGTGEDLTEQSSTTATDYPHYTRYCPAMRVIHPEKPFRVCWEALGLLVIVWVTMSLPFKLAFLVEELQNGDPFFYVQMFVNIFFIMDVALNFYTAYYDENDVLVTDAAAIKVHYLRSWFAVDFLSAIPFDYVVLALQQQYVSAWEGTKVIRLFKLFRLFRLLKLHNLYRFLGRYEEKLTNNSVKIFKLALVLILWLHFDSCLYFLIARWHQLDSGSWAPDSWVTRNGLEDAPTSKQYLWALWHVASHMLSVTYGPINPSRTEEVVATLISMMCGAALYAGIIGTTASIMQASDPSGSEFYRQWDELKVFMRHKEIPAPIRDRLRNYFNARWKGRKIFDEGRILSSLPEPYVRSLLMHECQYLVKSVSLLEAGGEGFVNAIVPLLQARLIMDGEEIISEREPPGVWWLINRGIVGLYRNQRKFAELDDGKTFGDVSLLYGVKAPFSVVTETPCQLYLLDRGDFEHLFSEFPELASKLKRECYKQCRRWGLSNALREAAARAEHASAFVQNIEFSWEAVEAELQAEASASGENIESTDNIFEYWAQHTDRTAYMRRYADLYGDAYDPDYDVHNIVDKLKEGFGKAGQVLRRVPQELNLRRTSSRGRFSSSASDDVPGHLNRTASDAFLHGFRRFGGGVESAFRDPASTFQRLGKEMRDGMRNVRARIATGVHPGRSPSFGASRSVSPHSIRSSHMEDNPFQAASSHVEFPHLSHSSGTYGGGIELPPARALPHPMTPIKEFPGSDTPNSGDCDAQSDQAVGIIQAPQLRSDSGSALSLHSSTSLMSASGSPANTPGRTALAALDARLRARERERNRANRVGSPSVGAFDSIGSASPRLLQMQAASDAGNSSPRATAAAWTSEGRIVGNDMNTSLNNSGNDVVMMSPIAVSPSRHRDTSTRAYSDIYGGDTPPVSEDDDGYTGHNNS